MVHNPNARGRAPRYKVNETERPKGVTTILGQTLAKDLMDWGISCAMDYLKTKLPVVTDADLKIAKDGHEHTECKYFSKDELPQTTDKLKKVLEILLM